MVSMVIDATGWHIAFPLTPARDLSGFRRAGRLSGTIGGWLRYNQAALVNRRFTS